MRCSNNHLVSGDVCKLCSEVLKEKKAPVTKIKRASDKRAKEEPKYRKLSRKFLSENTFCQAKLIGCKGLATDCHHSSGRITDYLNVLTFIAVCRECHNKIHNVLSAKENREKRLLV
jgi:hypothetical protein